jgi:hypothetical protein
MRSRIQPKIALSVRASNRIHPTNTSIRNDALIPLRQTRGWNSCVWGRVACLLLHGARSVPADSACAMCGDPARSRALDAKQVRARGFRQYRSDPAPRFAHDGGLIWSSNAFRKTNDMSRIRLHPLAFLAGVLVLNPAAAIPGTALDLYGRVGWAHDDNLLRIPDNAPAFDNRRSDSWTTVEIGAVYDKPIRRQRVFAVARVSKVKFDHFRQLDYDGRDLQATWHWQLGNRFSPSSSPAPLRWSHRFAVRPNVRRRV